MINWLQKIIVISVALITFGAISPSHELWTAFQFKEDVRHSNQSFDSFENENLFEKPHLHTIVSKEETNTNLISEAQNISFIKFGSKIGPVIHDEFQEKIFPQIESLISQMTAEQQSSSELYLTRKPSGGNTERIFNIKDSKTNKNIVLFHVRTEKRPLEGYYFNFHYHHISDNYNSHYSLGDIYWSKNTPPKWLP